MLYKVNYFPKSQQLDVKSIFFDNISFDSEILGSYIIDEDLICAVTKSQIIGFSTKKSKLIYRINLQEM